MNIETEIAWMENFRAASRLSKDQFDSILAVQRRLFCEHRDALENAVDPACPQIEGHRLCWDCGAIVSEVEECPICATVDHSQLPRMAFGMMLDEPGAQEDVMFALTFGLPV